MGSNKKSKKQKDVVNSKNKNFGNKYYDASVPGSYSGLSGFVKNTKNLKNTKDWSMQLYDISLFI